MEFWLTEKEYDHGNVGMTVRIKEQILHENTPYQVLDVFDTHHYGKMLTLDGRIQLTELDEFFYHEMIVHPGLLTHPRPRRVLVVGGGDGGTVRETLVHSTVERIDMAEIDECVIRACKRYFPRVSSGLDDPRVTIHLVDSIRYVAEVPSGTYDAVIVDSSDPIGPAVGLFHVDFYRNCHRILADPGILVCQTGTFWFQPEEARKAYQDVRSVFDSAAVYWTITPTYPAGNISFTLGTKGVDPFDFGSVRSLPDSAETRYYNRDIHRASFALPEYFRSSLDRDGGGE